VRRAFVSSSHVEIDPEVVSVTTPLPCPIIKTGIGATGSHQWMLHCSSTYRIPPKIRRDADWDPPSMSLQIGTTVPWKLVPT